MGTKKISLTLDEDLCADIEKAAKTFNMPKSRLARKAFRLWLEKETENLMAIGYEEMAKEDKAFAETAFNAQKEILS
jgi:metal-responsive CopG/Arc/MetJ family transcriptional regulator